MYSAPFNAKHRIGDVVAADHRTSAVFRSYKIDYCCGGKKSIDDICREKNIDVDSILDTLNRVASEVRRKPDPSEWPVPFLLAYIQQTHHAYVRRVLPEIRFLAEKVADVHGARHPELVQIRNLFLELQQEMVSHMADEEDRVFPAIASACEENSLLPMLDEFETEHTAAGAIMAQIEHLTDGYVPPEGACRSYQTLFQYLAAFQDDLHEHVHLENNVLFPACRVRRS